VVSNLGALVQKLEAHAVVSRRGRERRSRAERNEGYKTGGKQTVCTWGIRW